jgi:Helix-turn-helix domain
MAPVLRRTLVRDKSMTEKRLASGRLVGLFGGRNKNKEGAMSVDGDFVQAIRECTEGLRKITELIGVCTRELDEATRRIASLPWKMEPLQVTLADAAKMLSLSKHSVRDLVTKGELEATGKYTGLRVTVECIHAYIARETRANNPAASRVFDSPFGEKARTRRARMRYETYKESAPTTNSY